MQNIVVPLLSQDLPELTTFFVVEGKCPYFEGQNLPSKTLYGFSPKGLSQESYRKAMTLGMRRSGNIVYKPLCDNCRKCLPFRIVLERFQLSKSQKKLLKKCKDLFEITIHRPILDREHLDLYQRYQRDQHGNGMDEDIESTYREFLIHSTTDTYEIMWRDNQNKLVAVGIIDVVDDGISTVYFYWDEKYRDYSLGTYSVLVELDLCRQWGKQYYYLGYLIANSKTMAYKSQFMGGEFSDGVNWLPTFSRNLDEPSMLIQLNDIEQKLTNHDKVKFGIEK